MSQAFLEANPNKPFHNNDQAEGTGLGLVWRMTTMPQADVTLKAFLEANPNKPFHNNDLAEGTGYSSTTMSNAACALWKAGKLRRVGKGVWVYDKEEPVPETKPLDTQAGNPATVAAMDMVQDDKHYFEIKVTRASTSPAGIDYQTIRTRDGRTGIVVWDA